MADSTINVDVGSVAKMYNDIYRRPFQEITADHVWTDGNTFEIDNAQDVTFTLPLAADWPREEIYINRTGLDLFIATVRPSGSDTVGTLDYFTMAKRGEYVRLRSDGVDNWRIIDRRTQAIASIGQTVPVVFAATPTPAVLNVFDKLQVTTRSRCEALANSIEIVQIDVDDKYRINFSGSFAYNNNQVLTLQMYVDGVAVPETKSCTEGNNGCSHVSWSGVVDVPDPSILDLRVSVAIAGNATITGLSFTAERLGG